MKRLICAALALLLTLPAAGCNSGETTLQPIDTESSTDTTAPVTQPDIYADLPTGDYTGEELVFANEVESASWAVLMLDCETLTGEVLDNAVYNRNRTVEEKLGITIKVEEHVNAGRLKDAIIRNVMSGDDPYDVYDIPADRSAALVLEDYFVSTDTLGIDISKPWWNTTVMDSLTFNDTCYSIAGDLSIMLWEASYGLMYNKTLADKLGLPDQYQLVRDGKFTLDSVHEAMSSAYEDTNGDTVVDTEDTFGLTGVLRLMTYSMVAGGLEIVPRGDDSLPIFPSPSERLIEMYEKIFDVYFDNPNVHIAGQLVFKDISKNWHSLFTEGRALYYFEPIGASKNLRDASFDYGFLPMPKYDEDQEHYITPITEFAHVMHVTKANDDIEMIGIALENLAAESHKYVRDAYFEKVLDSKRTVDDESIEMLEIIFEHQVFEPVLIYNWGKLPAMLEDSALARKREITSGIASILPAIQSDLEKTANYYGK
ncbi:MAG: extracellular solute-binding protein [Clostridia bacterium]|nr:extracellular solute-binding protein [Clostridia bacterium]